ncbi:unnamed protein product, partial [Candidula unifasciata]
GLRIVCYYTSSAQHRAGVGRFTPKDVDPNLCTHLVYSHARINGFDLEATQTNDETLNGKLGMYGHVVSFRKKNPKLKVLLGVGSFMEMPQSFFPAAASKSSRAVFASSVATYLRNRHFDGAQMEWANLAAKPNPRYDKNKFLLLLKALREEFKQNSLAQGDTLILAVTLPAVKKHIDTGYRIPELSMQADFITIRTLDLHTASDGKVGLSAPLRSDPKSESDDKYLNVEWITKHYISLKVPKEKINIGIPTYGRSFRLEDGSHNKIGDKAVSNKGPVPLNSTDGIVGYAEVCQLVLAGGSVENDESHDGRYYTNGNLWISYEDILSVSKKTRFVKDLKLGGITFWTLDLDDFTGVGCQHGRYPLIRTAKRIVCYYTNWAQFRHGKGRFMPENIPAHLCTHIVYAYAVFKDFTAAAYLGNDDSKIWLEGMYGRVLRIKNKNPDLKILLGIGGGNSPDTNLEDLIYDTSMLENFAKSIATFLEERKFDGLEVSWQVPSSRWKPNFSYFLQILKTTFEKYLVFHEQPRLILSVALTASKERIEAGYGDELPRIAVCADFISLMTYDFHGGWDAHTGHNAPLFPNSDKLRYDQRLNVDWVAKHYVKLDIPKYKINIGVATYGRSFTLADGENHNLLAPAKGPGTAGKFTGVAGLLAYYEVCDFISKGANVSYIPSQRVPYAYRGNQWVGFDDLKSVFQKACYSVCQGFGGVSLWTLDFDDFTGDFCKEGQFPLLTTIYNILNQTDKDVCVK